VSDAVAGGNDPVTSVERPGEVWVAETDLQAGALSLLDALFQNITHIAPAIAGFFFTQFVVSLAGGAAVFAYVVSVVVVLGLGSCLSTLARRFPSAGGYFTYISRTVNPRIGFLSAWTFVFYSPVVTGPVCAFFGFILENQMKEQYNIHLPWWVFVIVALPIITGLMLLGITLSVRTIAILGSIEMLIVLAIGLWGLADPGPGGFTFEVFSPTYDPGKIAVGGGLALAVVFGVQGLTGWEAAVPLAEETENPRANIPKATIGSIIILGVLLVITYWGQVVGWGVNDLAGLRDSPQIPALVLGDKYWGSLWWIILIAMCSSVIAVSLATQNVATRMWYRMARQGALPAAVGRVDPKRKTPTVAILAQFVIALFFGIVMPIWIGPDTTFFLWTGLTLVLSIAFVYIMANLGVVLYFLREKRDEFNWFFHLVLPVGTSAVLLYAIWRSFYPDYPTHPYGYAPFIVGGWMILGVLILWYLHATGRNEWLEKAGAIVEERPETEEELAHRHLV
jgi:amino acid transporter